jgi:DNA-binding IclR family transcriptional regulator
MKSLDRMLSLLGHFSERSMTLDVGQAAEITGASRATAYRYISSLSDAGLLMPAAGGKYVLGPRVLELEMLARAADPLLLAARSIIRRHAEELGLNIMLCSHYGSRVLCADLAWPDRSLPEIYQRGRSMPIFRGAMAKIILANLSPAQSRRLYDGHAAEIRAAGLADSWDAFRATMARFRAEGVVTTRAEVFPDLVGMAAAVLDAERRVLGSVVFVIGADRFDRMKADVLAERLRAIAAEIEARIAGMAGIMRDLAPPARVVAAGGRTA